MSRDEVIAVVEAYLNGLAKKDLSNVPFAPDITFEGPRVPRLVGRQRVVGFLTSIMPLVKCIQIKRHLVDGEFVATMFDMETVNGTELLRSGHHLCTRMQSQYRQVFWENANQNVARKACTNADAKWDIGRAH